MFITRFIFIAVCLCSVTKSVAQERSYETISPPAEEQKPEFGVDLTSELQATHKGDINYVNLLKLSATIPVSQKLSVEAASISTCETAKESIGEDLQSFSNIEAGNVLFALNKFGVDWQIEDRHSLFLGIRNMNEDYFASPVTSFFTNSSCGIYPTLAANYPIANYPVASVGVHYRYECGLNGSSDSSGSNGSNGSSGSKGSNGSKASMIVQASLYNGTGYNRFYGRENVFRFCPKSDGVFGLAQLEYQRKGSSYFLGSSVYCNEDVSVTPWAYAEQRVNDRLKVIAGLSYAFTDNPVCKDFVGLGAHYESGKCEFGVFTDYANFAESEEWATELTCKYAINDNISLQPVTHLIVTGGQFKGIACLRLSISY